MKNLSRYYGGTTDILHLSYGESGRIETEEISGGIQIRRNLDSKKIVGYSIECFSKLIKDKKSPFYGLNIKNLKGIERILQNLY